MLGLQFMRFFKRPFGQKAGRKSGGASAGPSWTGFGASGTESPFDWKPTIGAPAGTKRQIAESRTIRSRPHPQDQERLDRQSAARTKASEYAAKRTENAARAKKIREEGGGLTGYNPYATSDTGHI